LFAAVLIAEKVGVVGDRGSGVSDYRNFAEFMVLFPQESWGNVLGKEGWTSKIIVQFLAGT